MVRIVRPFPIILPGQKEVWLPKQPPIKDRIQQRINKLPTWLQTRAKNKLKCSAYSTLVSNKSKSRTILSKILEIWAQSTQISTRECGKAIYESATSSLIWSWMTSKYSCGLSTSKCARWAKVKKRASVLSRLTSVQFSLKKMAHLAKVGSPSTV